MSVEQHFFVLFYNFNNKGTKRAEGKIRCVNLIGGWSFEGPDLIRVVGGIECLAIGRKHGLDWSVELSDNKGANKRSSGLMLRSVINSL